MIVITLCRCMGLTHGREKHSSITYFAMAYLHLMFTIHIGRCGHFNEHCNLLLTGCLKSLGVKVKPLLSESRDLSHDCHMHLYLVHTFQCSCVTCASPRHQTVSVMLMGYLNQASLVKIY